MCHTVSSLSDYLFNFYLSELLTMTVLLARVLTTLHLEDDDLVALYQGVHYFYYYLCTFYGGCANLDSAVGIYEQHFVKLISVRRCTFVHTSPSLHGLISGCKGTNFLLHRTLCTVCFDKLLCFFNRMSVLTVLFWPIPQPFPVAARVLCCQPLRQNGRRCWHR